MEAQSREVTSKSTELSGVRLEDRMETDLEERSRIWQWPC